jgi:hypothetical protein
MQSTQQLILYTLWFQNCTSFWALSQLKQSSLPAWTLKMHFSASSWPHIANPSLPSNGRILVLEKRNNWLALNFYKPSKMFPLPFGLPWHLTWRLSQPPSMAVHSFSTLLTFCWLGHLRRIVWKELTSFSPFCGRLDIRFPKRKLKFARILSHTSGFTHNKDNVDLALRGYRPSVLLQPPRPMNRLENF